MIPIIKASDLLKEVDDSAYIHPENEKTTLEKVAGYLNYLEEIESPRNVLDHGFVRLVDYMGNDLSVVRSARVSYNADWRTGVEDKSDTNLIRYLLRNKHTSPFESVVLTFEIKCPLDILRQWGRHRTQAYNDGAGIGYEEYWSYNQVSARYTELPEEFYVPKLENITTQAKDNKQARTTEQHANADLIQDLIRESCYANFSSYKTLLNLGCPREIARSVLPGATYTRLFGTVNLHNLLLWLRLRLHPHAQYEIRVYAEAVADILSHIVPVTMGAWMDMRLKEMEHNAS